VEPLRRRNRSTCTASRGLNNLRSQIRSCFRTGQTRFSCFVESNPRHFS
jgi:hypothetical protein